MAFIPDIDFKKLYRFNIIFRVYYYYFNDNNEREWDYYDLMEHGNTEDECISNLRAYLLYSEECEMKWSHRLNIFVFKIEKSYDYDEFYSDFASLKFCPFWVEDTSSSIQLSLFG